MGDVLGDVFGGAADVISDVTSSVLGGDATGTLDVVGAIAGMPGLGSGLQSGLDLLGTVGTSVSPPSGAGTSSTIPVSYPQPGFNVTPYTEAQFGQYGPGVGDAVLVANTGLAVLPRWAQSFPNLWRLIERIIAAARQSGVRVSVSRALDRIEALMKQYGPQALITLGFMTAQQAADYITYRNTRKKKRRLNPGNVKALRRSIRRLNGFERLSGRVSRQLASAVRMGGGIRARRSSGRKCGTCRKSPCCC